MSYKVNTYEFVKFPEDTERILEITHILKKKISTYNLGEMCIARNILKYDFVIKCRCGSRLITKYNMRCYECGEYYIDIKKEIKQCEKLLTTYYMAIMLTYIWILTIGIVGNLSCDFIIYLLISTFPFLIFPTVAIRSMCDNYKKMEKKIKNNK